MLRRFCCFAFLMGLMLPALTLSAAAQDRAAGLRIARSRAQHLKHGINASGWFAQAGDYSAARTDRYTDAADIALIAKLGFDNVRLSIDAAPLEQRPLGADGLNDDFVARLDKAVDTMLADGLAVQIDLHPEDSYKHAVAQQQRSGGAAGDAVAQAGRALCDARSGAGVLRDHERAGGERRVPLGGYPGARGGGDSRSCAAATRSSPRDRTTPTLWTCWRCIRWPMAT